MTTNDLAARRDGRADGGRRGLGANVCQRVYDAATPESAELGGRIRAARESRGMARSDVVRELRGAGVTSNAVDRIERGEFPVRRELLRAVQDLLGVE